MSLKVGTKCGGRIASLSYGNVEVLHRDTSLAVNWGSTFWPSPQVCWNWPPPAILDGCANAYAGAIVNSDTSIELNGAADNVTKLRFRKKMWMNSLDSSFQMRYTLVNTGSAASWAPWQDTRIPAGGLYFFPKGQNAVTGTLANLTRDSLGMIWFRYDSTRVPTTGTNKFFADGAQGWYAHVNSGRVLYIKKFTDTPLAKKAPDPEDEIGLYAENKRAFAEMEVQGAYASIPANDSMTWEIKWLLRRLPADMKVEVGNKALVDYVTATLAAGPSALREKRASYGRGRELRERQKYFLSRFNLPGRRVDR